MDVSRAGHPRAARGGQWPGWAWALDRTKGSPGDFTLHIPQGLMNRSTNEQGKGLWGRDYRKFMPHPAKLLLGMAQQLHPRSMLLLGTAR